MMLLGSTAKPNGLSLSPYPWTMFKQNDVSDLNSIVHRPGEFVYITTFRVARLNFNSFYWKNLKWAEDSYT